MPKACLRHDAGGTQPSASQSRPRFGLFGGNLQPLSPPDPLDALVVDHPSGRRPQQLRDLAIAVAAVLPGQFDDIGREPFLVISTLRCLAFPDRPTGGRPVVNRSIQVRDLGGGQCVAIVMARRRRLSAGQAGVRPFVA